MDGGMAGSSKEARRSLVQKMSTSASNLPGGVGERRKMRQHLEAFVDQKEMETADADENEGAGRLPAGFCDMDDGMGSRRSRSRGDGVSKSFDR